MPSYHGRETVQPRASAPSAASPFNHSRRSWVGDNGVHYTVQSTSFTSPGLSFNAMGGTAAGGLLDAFFMPDERQARQQHRHHPQQQQQQQQPPSTFGAAAGLLGTAFNLLSQVGGDQRQASTRVRTEQRNAPRRVQVAEEYSEEEEEEDGDEEYDDDDMACGESSAQNKRQSRSMFSKFKEKFKETTDRTKRAPSARAAQETRQPGPPRREDAGKHRKQSTVVIDDCEEDESMEDDDDSYESSTYSHRAPRAGNATDRNKLYVLETAVERHKEQVQKSRKRLERATRRNDVHVAQLQELLNEVQIHEQSLAQAQRSLFAEQTRQTAGSSSSNSRHKAHQHQSRPAPRRNQSAASIFEEFDDIFNMPGMFARSRASTLPLFSDFDTVHGHTTFSHPMFAFHSGPDFVSFGGHAGIPTDLPNFFTMPGTTFTNTQTKRARFNPHESGSTPNFNDFASFQPTPSLRPPPTLLTPDEAQRLFEVYNARWDALAPTDPNIPFPTRDLHAPALQARDTLWAPLISAHPSTWSEETAMQANAQAFFLNVCGLVPQYTDPTGLGRVEMGFDKSKATPAQTKALLDLLKKEKTRWHSDKLGRRNGGKPGVNEALQKDVRARAVFHAVCELMEKAS